MDQVRAPDGGKVDVVSGERDTSRSVRLMIAALFGVVVALGGMAVVDGGSDVSAVDPPVNTQVRHPDAVEVEVVELPPAEQLRGMIGHRALTQQPHTSGPSPDTLRMMFDAPAEVHGVMISVDVSMPLVEVVAGVNVSEPYGIVPDDDLESQAFQPDANWLIHTSSTEGRDIDEHVMFPKPIRVEAGDYIALWGWVRNGEAVPKAVHPEMIVYYETLG